MQNAAVAKELIKLEKQFWRALKDNDVDAALSLSTDPCIVTGAQGVARLSKKAFAGMMENPEWTLDDFEISGAEVEQVSDDVAIIGYKVREELTVDGKKVTVEAADASTWVRKNGGWVCALHTESLAGDPYGRDKTPATPTRRKAAVRRSPARKPGKNKRR